MWDKYKGCWVEDPENPPPKKRRVGRPSKEPPPREESPPPREDFEEEGDVRTEVEMPAVKRVARKFQSTWKTVLPWLIFVAGVAVDVSVCPSAEGDKCRGCSERPRSTGSRR